LEPAVDQVVVGAHGSKAGAEKEKLNFELKCLHT
jgi:hypothetical protein